MTPKKSTIEILKNVFSAICFFICFVSTTIVLMLLTGYILLIGLAIYPDYFLHVSNTIGWFWIGWITLLGMLIINLGLARILLKSFEAMWGWIKV